jgi:prolyl-tRNA editing enzyme YbaK/EbsC (Cys-tRNA(Pro) deacylase)
MTQIQTKITKLLDQHQINYRLLPHSEPVFTVAAAAAQRGVVKEEMVKSILMREKSGQQRYAMACVLGHMRVDHRAVRECLSGDWKRLTFCSAAEITQMCGYVQGAVAPLSLPEDITIIFDVAIVSYNNVNISSGDPMAGIELKSTDLLRLSGAICAPIAQIER